MTEQAAQARREYKRAWARANRDKVKAQQERHWAKKAAEAAAAGERDQKAQDPAEPMPTE